MRIALVAPLVSPIAPPYLGGAQALLADLAAGLAGRGHQVTLFAASGSAVPHPGVVVRDLGIDSSLLTPARFDAPLPAPGGAGSLPAPAARANVPPSATPHTAPAGWQPALQAPYPAPAGKLPALQAPPPDPDFFPSAHAFLRVFSQLQQELDDFDLVHAHAFDWPAFAYGALIAAQRPMLHTLHLPAVSPAINAVLGELHQMGNPTRLITVSRACARTYAPYAPMHAIIPNGIDTDAIPFGATADPDDFLLFAGRITPEKGVVEAIEIARRAGKPLLLAGGTYDQDYMNNRVRPLLAEGRAPVPPASLPVRAGAPVPPASLPVRGGAPVPPASLPVRGGAPVPPASLPVRAGSGTTYLGPLPQADLWRLMSRASALLFPIGWDEPFGLAAAEALAAGCPVIAFARGALPEILTDGETGFLIPPGDLDAAARAVSSIPALSRAACRQRAAQHFSQARMLDDYERVYLGCIDNSPPRR
jgi:glycosyltransferase involved in cell wall biosynthesis